MGPARAAARAAHLAEQMAAELRDAPLAACPAAGAGRPAPAACPAAAAGPATALVERFDIEPFPDFSAK